MKIKPKPRTTRKQKSYLKWMGLIKPKKAGRLGQGNKSNSLMKKVYCKSELQKAIAALGESEVVL